jgi:hypothetical protein
MKKFQYISEEEWEKMDEKSLIHSIKDLSSFIFSNPKLKLSEVELDSCDDFDVRAVKPKGIQMFDSSGNDTDIVLFEEMKEKFSKKELKEIYWNFQGTYLNEIR